MRNSIKYILLILFLIGATSQSDQLSDHPILQALQSSDRNTIQIAIWTLMENDIKIPAIEMYKTVEEIQPLLKELIDTLLQYPDSTLYNLDSSFFHYETLYSP
ncbi:MAG: hypothetical protein ACP5FK_12510, partial [bacterium]